MAEMAVLDRTGDYKVIWNQNEPETVEAARSSFDVLRSKGYIAYSVDEKGDQGEVLREFDPTKEKMILAPAMQGG